MVPRGRADAAGLGNRFGLAFLTLPVDARGCALCMKGGRMQTIGKL